MSEEATSSKPTSAKFVVELNGYIKGKLEIFAAALARVEWGAGRQRVGNPNRPIFKPLPESEQHSRGPNDPIASESDFQNGRNEATKILSHLMGPDAGFESKEAAEKEISLFIKGLQNVVEGDKTASVIKRTKTFSREAMGRDLHIAAKDISQLVKELKAAAKTVGLELTLGRSGRGRVSED